MARGAGGGRASSARCCWTRGEAGSWRGTWLSCWKCTGGREGEAAGQRALGVAGQGLVGWAGRLAKKQSRQPQGTQLWGARWSRHGRHLEPCSPGPGGGPALLPARGAHQPPTPISGMEPERGGAPCILHAQDLKAPQHSWAAGRSVSAKAGPGCVQGRVGQSPRTQTASVSVAGMRRPRSHSALAPREGPGKPQRPPGAQVTLPPAQVGTRLWAPGRSQARTEAAGGRDSLPVSATLVQPEVRSARSIHTRVHTCAQNEHMWKRGVFRAGDAQRATRPSQGQKPACVPRPPAGGSRPCGHAPRMPTARASGRTLPPGPGEPSHTEASWRREGQQALEAISSFQGQAAWVRGRLRAWEEPWWAPALGEGGCSRRHARFCTGAVTPRGPGLLPRLGLQRSASQAQAPSAGEHMLPVPGRRSPPHGGWDGRWPPAAGPDVKRSSVGGSLPLE